MFNIIPLVLILISLAVIISIIIRKFPVLANLNIDSIQAEREAKFKEQIIGNRLKRNFFRYYNQVMRFARPVGAKISELLKWGYDKLIEFKDNYNKEEAAVVDADETVKKLFVETEDLLKKEDFETAEKKLIEIIGLDSKNVEAFRELGQVYFNRKDYNEAKQTWEHALKLTEKEAESLEQETDKQAEKERNSSLLSEFYYDLAQVGLKIENLSMALANIRKALSICPNSPRYLDMKLEISIIKKDKPTAERTLIKLKKVNPDNKKIEELEKVVSSLQ